MIRVLVLAVLLTGCSTYGSEEVTEIDFKTTDGRKCTFFVMAKRANTPSGVICK